MTEEIKQTEKGALEFAQKVYGEDLADAMYLGTYGGISYFGPIFYEKDATRPSFLITYSEREYHFLPSEKFALDSDEDMKDFERRQHIWWDYNAVIQSAYRRGKRKGMASRMKAKGIAIEDIAEITGLNTWEIEAL
jgi:hypothetical protein